MLNSELQVALQDILNVVIFENWLRFYFIEEQVNRDNPEELLFFIKIPAKSMIKIRELYPELSPLAEEMNNKPVNFQISRSSVLTYILNHLEGSKLSRGLAEKVISSKEFQVKLQLFNTWVQLYEEQLDHGFHPFQSWLTMFSEWRKSKAGQAVIQKMEGE